MAVTFDLDDHEAYRSDVGQTDGNEVVYKVDPDAEVVIEALETASGSARLLISTDPTQPAALTDMDAGPAWYGFRQLERQN